MIWLWLLIVPLGAKLHSMEGQGVPHAGLAYSLVAGTWILPIFPYAYPLTVLTAKAGMQAANVFFRMGRDRIQQIKDIESGKRDMPTLTWLLLKIKDWDLHSAKYAWVHFGIKGLLIVPPCALFWPLGYEIAWQYHENVKKLDEPTNIGEYIAGGFGLFFVALSHIIFA